LFVGAKAMMELQGKVSYHELLVATHKSFGVLVLLLLAWRIYLLVRVWGKKYSKHLPKFTGNWYFKTALHTLLYLMMFAVPLSGYWLANAYHLHLFPVDSDAAAQASAAHSRTSKVFAILIFIHFVCQHKVVKANWRRFSNWAFKTNRSQS
jgi:cytochrome b561